MSPKLSKRPSTVLRRVLGILPRGALDKIALCFAIDPVGKKRHDVIDHVDKVDDKAAVGRKIGRAVAALVESGR